MDLRYTSNSSMPTLRTLIKFENFILFQCDYCGDEPIIGTRWHCTTCSTQESIDFCSDCLVSQLYSERQHPTSHRFVGMRVGQHTQMASRMVSDDGSDDDDDEDDTADDRQQMNLSNGYDKDYMIHKFAKANYNYMDPNFLPE